MHGIVILRRLGLALLDATLVAVSLQLAYLMRFDFRLYELDHNQFLVVLPVVVALRLLLFFFFNLYRGLLRYAGLGEMIAIVLSTALGSILLFLANLMLPRLPGVEWLPQLETGRLQRVPLGVMLGEGAFTILFMAAGRFSRRIFISRVVKPFSGNESEEEPRRVLIVGAGDAGEAVARQMIQAPVRAWKPVAFVDDDPTKRTFRIHGIPVAGSLRDIPEVIRTYDVQEVLVAFRKPTPATLREIVTLCEHANVGFRILPSVQDILTGRVSINQIRPVEIEDLLGRDELKLELPDDRNYLKDQVVMITGAGGSIGSELCRQVLRFGPKQLVLLGHGENSIYEISQELIRQHGPEMAKVFVPVIGDIRDRAKLLSVARKYQPSIFFHAAAHKHVPLMEHHPDEAVKNNVLGTRNIAEVAEEVGARRFIMISSDKAVRPTNVMGATKRVAEMIVFHKALTSKTQFVAVRFGNVLGSRGSVVPLFKKQIAQGGPVTLTHPDVVRYFMTIPEAVSLVIQAGSMKEQRRLYLLDMGQPVKIVDLARNLIRLSGFEPDKEIEVRFTGLRPGEKLKEELLTADENINTTGIGKIFVTEPERVDPEHLHAMIDQLLDAANRLDGDRIRAILTDLVPDYGPEQKD